MDIVTIVLTVVGIVVAIVIGGGQIYLAKSMKDFEARQDARDEFRRKESVYAEATRFIQKYSNDDHKSEILLLPICVSAYKYNDAYPYRREIYREFCSLTEDVQNEILTRQGLTLHSCKVDNFYNRILCKIESNIKSSYPNDKNAYSRFFYENGKYLYRALKHHGKSLIPTDLRCEVDSDEEKSRKSPFKVFCEEPADSMAFQDHLTNLLAYHKDGTPLSDLIPYFQNSDEIVACYICCEIAKYTAIYNCNDPEENGNIETNLGYADDYSDQLYMEDLFLEVLHTVENYSIKESGCTTKEYLQTLCWRCNRSKGDKIVEA